MKEKPSDYLRSGRFFASIEMHEGPEMLRMVTESMGDGVLMLGSDYPHPESMFPESNDVVLGWSEQCIPNEAIQKLAWENTVRCFGQP